MEHQYRWTYKTCSYFILNVNLTSHRHYTCSTLKRFFDWMSPQLVPQRLTVIGSLLHLSRPNISVSFYIVD